MRIKLYLPIISLLAMSVFVFISCDDSDSDTTKPVIELHEPEEGQALKIGSEYGVHFITVFTTNYSSIFYKQ